MAAREEPPSTSFEEEGLVAQLAAERRMGLILAAFGEGTVEDLEAIRRNEDASIRAIEVAKRIVMDRNARAGLDNN